MLILQRLLSQQILEGGDPQHASLVQIKGQRESHAIFYKTSSNERVNPSPLKHDYP